MSNTKINKSTKDLISSLCEEHEGVKCLACPIKRAIGIFSLIVLYNLIVVSFFDTMRHDVSEFLYDPSILYEIVLIIVMGMAATLSASYLMVPDMKGQKWLLSVPTTLLGAFSIWMIISFMDQGYKSDELHILGRCLFDGVIYASLPAFFIVYIVRRGASVHQWWLTAMSVLSVACMGWVSLRFVCSVDNATHIFIDHIFPFTIIGLVLALLSKRLFSW